MQNPDDNNADVKDGFKKMNTFYQTGRNTEKFKDAMTAKQVFAYAIGHLANDLVINVWNTYSTWYMNQAINMTDEESGLVVLVGQIIDAIAQPLVGYCSDTLDTRIGKRMPWYLFGHICTLPAFYLVFNPPLSAIGYSRDEPRGLLSYFILVPGIMNIGQGAIQLSHMSIVNSITYDQRRRDILINYRNSTSYFAGIFVPITSFVMFTYYDNELD